MTAEKERESLSLSRALYSELCFINILHKCDCLDLILKFKRVSFANKFSPKDLVGHGLLFRNFGDEILKIKKEFHNFKALTLPQFKMSIRSLS